MLSWYFRGHQEILRVEEGLPISQTGSWVRTEVGTCLDLTHQSQHQNFCVQTSGGKEIFTGDAR